MSDAWNDIQALKSKQSNLRARLAQRKKEREDFLAGISIEATGSQLGDGPPAASKGEPARPKPDAVSSADSQRQDKQHAPAAGANGGAGEAPVQPELSRAEVERRLLRTFEDVTVEYPLEVTVLSANMIKATKLSVPLDYIENIVQKLAAQQLISIEKRKNMENPAEPSHSLVVTSANQSKIALFLSEGSEAPSIETPLTRKRKITEGDGEHASSSKSLKKEPETPVEDISIESLLAVESAKERENKKSIEEILELLSRPSAKEQYLVERFKSQGGALQEFCAHGTREECSRATCAPSPYCTKVHFKKIINKHTDESLGDCSFLNTCFHMDTCKYVHYTIDQADIARPGPSSSGAAGSHSSLVKKSLTDGGMPAHKMMPPQWVQCDLRTFDVSVLGKFAVIMADPPWDIHMELPYGTMSDDEMRSLNIPSLQDDGYIFLWVTGRAMELGRECLELWGYQRCDELIWVKTNQLQRIIRTGRTGHWINHGKEHCLIGVKGSPKNFNRGLDCDVIVAEVRATSHKPDEVYGIIERLAPGTRKIELFGRPHNVQPNWVTLGNQLEGVQLHEEEVVKAFVQKYPDGNCMGEPKPAQLL